MVLPNDLRPSRVNRGGFHLENTMATRSETKQIRYNDPRPTFQDDEDPSKKLVLDMSGLAPGEKAVLAVPPAASGAASGTAAGSGVTAVEFGEGIVHKTVLTFVNTPVVLADAAAVVAYGGLKVYDMPAGAILMLGAVADVDLTKSSAGVNADWDGDMGVGTVTASNNATLSSTEQNIIPTTATPQAAAGATTANGKSTATENAVLDGTTTPIDVFFNLLVDDVDHDVTTTPCDLILNGTLTLHWINLGDY